MAEGHTDQRHERTRRDSQQIWDTDAEVGSFENIVLHLNSDEVNNTDYQLRLARRIVRSISEANLSTKAGFEVVCSNCQQGKITSGKIREMMKLQEQLVRSIQMLTKKTVDYDELLRENEILRKSNDVEEVASPRSFFSKVLAYSPVRRSVSSTRGSYSTAVEKDNQIVLLTRQLSEYELALQNNNQKLRDQAERFKKQRQSLKKNFSQKTEIQKEILEKADSECKRWQDQVEVESQIRVKREAEVASLRSYLLQKERSFYEEMRYKDEYVERMKSEHTLELEKCHRKIKQKDEEILLTKQKYESLMKTCQSYELTSSLDTSAVEKGRLDKIIRQNLDQDLQLKIRQLDDSNSVIKTLEEDMKVKQQQLDAIILSRSVKSDTDQLENFKVHLIELINNLEVEIFSKDSQNALQQSISVNGEISNNCLVNSRIGDKEEAE